MEAVHWNECDLTGEKLIEFAQKGGAERPAGGKLVRKQHGLRRISYVLPLPGRPVMPTSNLSPSDNLRERPVQLRNNREGRNSQLGFLQQFLCRSCYLFLHDLVRIT